MSKATDNQAKETNVLDTQIEANTQGVPKTTQTDLGNNMPQNAPLNITVKSASENVKQWRDTPVKVESITQNPQSTPERPSYTVKFVKEAIIGIAPFQTRRKETYYFNASSPEGFHVGMELMVDLSTMFDVVESVFQTVDDKTGELLNIRTKWLYIKGFAPKQESQPVQAAPIAQPVEPRF